MSTLAERLHRALRAKPDLSQAGLARYCSAKPPSVSDWMRGETKTLKAQSMILAAEYLGVRARWLLDGSGPMSQTQGTAATSAPATVAAPQIDVALQVVLDAIAASAERAELEHLLPLLLTGAPEYRKRLADLLSTSPSPGHHGTDHGSVKQTPKRFAA